MSAADARRRLQRFAGLPERVARQYRERAEVIRLASAAGMNPTEIAHALGVSRAIVYDALERGKR